MGKTLNRTIKKLWEALIEIIYPRENYCIICGEDDCFGICNRCKESIKFISESYQEEIISCGYYGGVLKELILKFKYKNDFTAGDILAEILEEYIAEKFCYKEYVLAYIPLSKKSQKARGFNQCEYIARKIAISLEIEAIELLIKVKETKEQKKLKKDERFKNIRGAFGVKKGINIKNKKIILIDDVTTTGATLKEASELLKKFDISDIKLLTLAKSHI
ncbi:phosphoribosyltransferase family protein [Clostridium sp. C2-6-12]|uniref:ComF family protein n=1 Tax=Clostridium sp. C2-6-12 TaxID=2698832 RepID=UPI0013705CF3|nr:phosphoribosyltransferase family protein [Clostridium sp. C2-6-12]